MGLFKPIWMLENLNSNNISQYFKRKKKAITRINEMNDREELKRIVKEAKVEELRAHAAARLNDQEALADIAKNSYDIDARYAAIDNLTNQAVLADIAVLHDYKNDAYMKAISRLTDQAILIDIFNEYKTDYPNSRLCEAVIYKLKDMGIFTDEMDNVLRRINVARAQPTFD